MVFLRKVFTHSLTPAENLSLTDDLPLNFWFRNKDLSTPERWLFRLKVLSWRSASMVLFLLLRKMV